MHDGRLTPKVRLTPGERIDVEVVVRRPGALSWALGDTRREHLTITTPVVRPTTRWVSVPHGSAVTVAFDGAVAGEATGAARRTLRPAQTRGLARCPARRRIDGRRRRRADLGAPAARDADLLVSADREARGRQRTGGRRPAVAARHRAARRSRRPSTTPIGDAEPTLTPETPGRFTRPDPHTLLFTPSGDGFGVGTGPCT